MSKRFAEITNCLLCGVGGQGTVLASRLIARTAMNLGCFARTAETIGMAQRGGSVVSHARWALDRSSILSPIVPPGSADVLIAFESGEAVRCLSYLKTGGAVIVSDLAIPSVPMSLSGAEYKAEPFIAFVKSQVKRTIVVDAAAIAAASGSARTLNVGLIGAACRALGFTPDELLNTLGERMDGKMLEMNRRAFEAGMAAGEMIGV